MIRDILLHCPLCEKVVHTIPINEWNYMHGVEDDTEGYNVCFECGSYCRYKEEEND